MALSLHSVIQKKVDRLHEIAERIRIIYNPPRELFTIGIPIAVALLIVIGAAITGMTLTGNAPSQQSTQNSREQALQEFLAQMNETSNLTGTAPSATTTNTPSMGLDEILVFATIIAITPYAIDITLQKRSTRKKEELYTEFLFKLSELMRGGLDPIKAVKELSKTDLGILTPHIRIASTSMTFGKSFEEAMKAMARSLHSELITRYTMLVVQASYSGGSVADLILKASEDMRSIISIEREKEGNLHQYVMIFYFAQGIIVFIVYMLTTSLLPFVQKLGSTSIFGTNQLADIDFSRGFFHMIMLNAFFGGLIIGKISEGEARYGLKHVVVLMIACFFTAAFFILPPPAIQTGPKVNITVVSGDAQNGFVNLPLGDPVVFKLTDPLGNPVNSTVVQFAIIPGGNVTPDSDISDNSGIVRTRVVLGANPVTYIITATANGAIGKATATGSTGG
jgi:flagellar protein FlaJ